MSDQATADQPVPTPAPKPAPDPTVLQVDQFRSVSFVLVLLTGVGFFVMLIILAFHEVPKDNEGVFNTLVGVLGTSFASLGNFFFGSSRSSQAKDTTINNLSQS